MMLVLMMIGVLMLLLLRMGVSFIVRMLRSWFWYEECKDKNRHGAGAKVWLWFHRYSRSTLRPASLIPKEEFHFVAND
jgi:hypothetical protein